MHKLIRKNILLFSLFCLVCLNLFGCARKSDLEKARSYVKQSQNSYTRAVNSYRDLIARTKDTDSLRMELGELYYQHGDFKEAAEVLKNASIRQAKKFLALAYYRLGNFTDALEVFSKNDFSEGQDLYYYGLTCEKLNLFDRAVEIYKKIRSGKFYPLAIERLNIITKEAAPLHIKDISPEINAMIAAATGLDQYPQAGALVLLADEQIRVNRQNTQVSQLHYVIKILNERGREDFSESHIDYDSTYEKVELEYARTIRPDGTTVEVGSRHIRDVSRYMNFPLYSNARVYIISFPEVAIGAVIEYKLKVYRNELINKKDFVISYPVQSGDPIIAAKFTLDLPKDKTVHMKILNERYNDFSAKLKPESKEQNGRLIYSWVFKNIPQILPEPNMPPAVEINPTIILSTFSSWKEIYDWWWGLAKDKIAADAAIKEKVKRLTAQAVSDEEKIRAIYNFCAKEIRYVAVEYGQAGYEPHQATDIFKNKYGDCKDQAVLLVTMLKEEGFSAWLVLISTRDYYNLSADFPSMLFNHCIAAVSLNGKTVFLDPTAETCSFADLPGGDQKRKVLIFKEGQYVIADTPLYPAAHNLLTQALRIKINPDESIDADRDLFTHGAYDQAQRYWLLYTPPQLIEERLKERIQEISIGAKLKSYKIENLDNLNKEIVLKYWFWGPEYLIPAGKLMIMPQLASLDVALVAKDSRRYALDFGLLDTRETAVEFEVPSTFTVKYIPQSLDEDTPWLRLKAAYAQKGRGISFRQRIEFKTEAITQEDYPAFKKAFTDLAKKIKQSIVLERTR